MSKVHIRTMTDKDTNFIISSWLMSYYNLMTSKRPNKKEYFREHQELVKHALLNDATWVACNADDHDQIIGWINFGDNYINYVFIKELFEGMGISSALIAQTGIDEKNFICTHYTKLFHVKHSKRLNIDYNPYLFLKQKEQYYEDQSS